MYWTDWEEDEIDASVGRIEKAWMDGYSRQVFVTSKMLWPNGLTLDYRANVLYWCDAYYDHIERIYLNGTDRKVKEKRCWFATGAFYLRILLCYVKNSSQGFCRAPRRVRHGLCWNGGGTQE